MTVRVMKVTGRMMLILLGQFACLSTASLSALANDGSPKVVVLVEKGLVPVGGTPALPPSRIVELLAIQRVGPDFSKIPPLA